ncbi:MAG: hypothetical protein ACHQ7M_03785 [Chloroflexota bacterium]
MTVAATAVAITWSLLDVAVAAGTDVDVAEAGVLVRARVGLAVGWEVSVGRWVFVGVGELLGDVAAGGGLPAPDCWL